MSTTRTAAAAQGESAETAAAEFLSANGLTVIGRNLRCKAGELDLVCLDGETLVIVEVRQRTRMNFGGALASVTRSKQRKLIRATLYHWQCIPGWRGRALRFDVVALQGAVHAAHAIVWIRDAFRVT